MTTFPTIHLNGSSKQELLNDYLAAINAVQYAMTTLRRVGFNARDYYVQGSDAYKAACDERIAQFAKLKEVEEYLTEIALHISNT